MEQRDQTKHPIKKFLLVRWLFVVPGILALLVTLYAQTNPDWVEQTYSLSLYPTLSSIVGYLPSLVGFSFTEWLIIFFALFVLGYVIYYVSEFISVNNRRVKRARRKARQLPEKGARAMVAYRGVVGLIAILSIVYTLFTLLCGLNYYRHTFTSYTGYTVEQSSVDELNQLCVSLAEELNQTRGHLGENTDLFSSEEGGFERYAAQSVAAMQTLSGQYPVLSREFYSQPKPVLFSGFMSDAGIGGMFFPFTAESNINKDAPFFTQPSTMAHELAHQCGFMREDEANFIAYLACRQSTDTLMRYSGQLLAFNHSIAALYNSDSARASEILSSLSTAVKRDRAQNHQFWSLHEGMVTQVSRATNDAYLRANNQTDGVQSYGRMVDLLLAEQRVGG